MTVITRPVPNRARWAPLLAAVAAGLAAVGVGAAVNVLDDDPPPTVEPTPTVATPATPAHQLTVADEVALLHAATSRPPQLTVAEEVALLHNTATTVPTTVDICLSQTPC
jgi:hypothetical protein